MMDKNTQKIRQKWEHCLSRYMGKRNLQEIAINHADLPAVKDYQPPPDHRAILYSDTLPGEPERQLDTRGSDRFGGVKYIYFVVSSDKNLSRAEERNSRSQCARSPGDNRPKKCDQVQKHHRLFTPFSSKRSVTPKTPSRLISAEVHGRSLMHPKTTSICLSPPLNPPSTPSFFGLHEDSEESDSDVEIKEACHDDRMLERRPEIKKVPAKTFEFPDMPDKLNQKPSVTPSLRQQQDDFQQKYNVFDKHFRTVRTPRKIRKPVPTEPEVTGGIPIISGSRLSSALLRELDRPATRSNISRSRKSNTHTNVQHSGHGSIAQMASSVSGKESGKKWCYKAQTVTSRSKRKNTNSLSLPKVDIVSSAYDKLLIKSIESYLLKNQQCQGSHHAQVAHDVIIRLNDRCSLMSKSTEGATSFHHQGVRSVHWAADSSASQNYTNNKSDDATEERAYVRRAVEKSGLFMTTESSKMQRESSFLSFRDSIICPQNSYLSELDDESNDAVGTLLHGTVMHKSMECFPLLPTCFQMAPPGLEPKMKAFTISAGNGD